MTNIFIPALIVAVVVPVVLLVTWRLLTGAPVQDWTDDEPLPTGYGREVLK